MSVSWSVSLKRLFNGLAEKATIQGAFAALAFGLGFSFLKAASPAWWSDKEVVNPEAVADNYAVANIGQLKHIAAMAAAAMDDSLPEQGGAGNEIDAMISGWSVQSPGNYNVLNLGQLKNVAEPFYVRLVDQLGYIGPPFQPEQIIIPGKTRPWIGVADNYALANIGQIKNLFSFDLESHFFSRPLVVVTSAPDLTARSVAGYYAIPVTVAAYNLFGYPIPDLELKLQIQSGEFRISSEMAASPGTTVTLRTNPNGEGAFYVYFTGAYSSVTTVDVSSDMGWLRSIDLAIRDYLPPEPPSDIAVGASTDSSVTLSWTAASDDFAVSRYLIYRNNQLVGYASSTNYVDTEVVQGTAYEYYVVSEDIAGRASLPSLHITAYALGSGAITAPTSLVGVVNDLNEVRLTWSPSRTNGPICAYQVIIRESGVDRVIATTAGLEWTVRGLPYSTACTFKVKALSASLSSSPVSSSVVVTTGSATGLRATAGEQHTVLWKTTGPSRGTGYDPTFGILKNYDDWSGDPHTATYHFTELSRFTESTMVVAGGLSTLSLGANGVVEQSGMYSLSGGQVQMDREIRSYPQLAGKTITAIGAGPAQNFAIETGGYVWSWGYNLYYQLGRSISGSYAQAPGRVKNENGSDFTGAVEVAASGVIGVARKTDSTVWAWGLQKFAGHSTLPSDVTSTVSPDQVYYIVPETGSPAALTSCTQISAGLDFAVALRQGKVLVWGNNEVGQLGANTADTWFPWAQPVRTNSNGSSQLSNAVLIAAGHKHGLALDSSGDVWSWGDNSHRQLGNSTGSYRKWAQKVVFSDPAGAVQISSVAAGAFHSVAIDTKGRVWTWGKNTEGQLGNGQASTTPVPTPARINLKASPLSFTRVAFGGAGAANLYISVPEMGVDLRYSVNGDDPSNSHPVLLPGTPLVVSSPTLVKARAYKEGAAIGDTFRTYCLVGAKGTAVNKRVGYIDSGQKTWVWAEAVPAASSLKGNLPQRIAPTLGFVDLVFGRGHSVARDASGTLYGWGSNQNGQLTAAFGASVAQPQPIPMQTVRSAGLAAGRDHTLIIDDSSRLWSWGLNHAGQLGHSFNSLQASMGQVLRTDGAPLVGLRSVVAGFGFSLAVTEAGELWGWGNEQYLAPLSDPSLVVGQSRSARLIKIREITAIAVASQSAPTLELSHAYALRADGTVWSWGWNMDGQLGIGVTHTETIVANIVQVTQSGGTPLTNVIAIASGEAHGMALKSDGTVWTWGKGDAGQLGYAASQQLRAAAVSLPSPVVWIAAGDDFCLAGDNLGRLWAWGDNSKGQLGDGTFSGGHVPRLVSTASAPGNHPIPDAWMARYGLTNPSGEADDDGLTNLEEYLAGTDPLIKDTDGDGLLDGDEIMVFKTNPALKDAFAAKGDHNGDGLEDGYGFELGISPYNMDVDGDEVTNSVEVQQGTDPLNPDSDEDDTWDGLDAFPTDPAYKTKPTVDHTPDHPPAIQVHQPQSTLLSTSP